MEIFAFILAILAAGAFAWAARTRDLLAVGLLFVTVAWVVQLVTNGHQVHS